MRELLEVKLREQTVASMYEHAVREIWMHRRMCQEDGLGRGIGQRVWDKVKGANQAEADLYVLLCWREVGDGSVEVSWKGLSPGQPGLYFTQSLKRVTKGWPQAFNLLSNHRKQSHPCFVSFKAKHTESQEQKVFCSKYLQTSWPDLICTNQRLSKTWRYSTWQTGLTSMNHQSYFIMQQNNKIKENIKSSLGPAPHFENHCYTVRSKSSSKSLWTWPVKSVLYVCQFNWHLMWGHTHTHTGHRNQHNLCESVWCEAHRCVWPLTDRSTCSVLCQLRRSSYVISVTITQQRDVEITAAATTSAVARQTGRTDKASAER